METMRLAFDATVEEQVDASFRFASRTQTYRRTRFRSQATTGLSFAVVSVGSVVLRARPSLSFEAFAIVTIIGLGGALLFGYLYGFFHDWYIRNNIRQMTKELFGGADSISCEFEVRPDGLFCRTKNAEVSLPWSRLDRINDTDAAVELWFNPGLAIVRNRAFGTIDDRRNFLEAVSRFRPLKTA